MISTDFGSKTLKTCWLLLNAKERLKISTLKNSCIKCYSDGAIDKRLQDKDDHAEQDRLLAADQYGGDIRCFKRTYEIIIWLFSSLSRFNTTAGNPVKKILLKLNLSDHRSILTDCRGYLKMVVEVPDSSWLTRSIATCSYPTDKHKDIMKAQMQSLQDGVEIVLVDDLKDAQITLSNTSNFKEHALIQEVNDTTTY
ncbi:hypothetical protein Tco_0309010 [Tanacetum coccineum]